jgi:hypothetical protein
MPGTETAEKPTEEVAEKTEVETLKEKVAEEADKTEAAPEAENGDAKNGETAADKDADKTEKGN